MGCPFLDYRTRDDSQDFGHERAYCELTDSFVAPLRADICNEANDWTPKTHCEIFRDYNGSDK